jgi:hypothetical protein
VNALRARVLARFPNLPEGFALRLPFDRVLIVVHLPQRDAR